MRVHLIDVGQGLCVLLEFPCGAVLVDAGGDDASAGKVIGYLTQFFNRRTDLNETLEAVYITHPHIDHNTNLREVVESNITVKRFIDDGLTPNDEGGKAVRWVRTVLGSRNIKLREVTQAEVESVPGRSGLTDENIDPLSCGLCDPKVVILAGGRGTGTTGWREKENNNSLVIRVDFGQSSVLLTGDLEVEGIRDMMRNTPASLLDVDIYQVGHHGSHNATTADFVRAMTPKIALLGVGKWDDGKSTWDDGEPYNRFCTFAFGHPRTVTLDILQAGISGLRNQPAPITAFTGWVEVKPRVGHGVPAPYTITKKIYGTGWDGTTVVRAKLDGTLTVNTESN